MKYEIGLLQVSRHIVFYCACGMLLYWTDPSGSDPNVELCVIGRTVTINVITADDDTEREHIPVDGE